MVAGSQVHQAASSIHKLQLGKFPKKKLGKRLSCKGGQPLEQKVCAGQRRRNPGPWGCLKPKGYALSKLTKLQSWIQAQGWPCFKQGATRKDLQRSPPAQLILGAHFPSQFHGKVKAGGGGGGNSLLSNYSTALKSSDSKGQIISWGEERNVKFYFHYRPP